MLCCFRRYFSVFSNISLRSGTFFDSDSSFKESLSFSRFFCVPLPPRPRPSPPIFVAVNVVHRFFVLLSSFLLFFDSDSSFDFFFYNYFLPRYFECFLFPTFVFFAYSRRSYLHVLHLSYVLTRLLLYLLLLEKKQKNTALRATAVAHVFVEHLP